MTQETGEQHIQAPDDAWRAFFFTSEINGLDAWSTEELLTEALTRNTDDAPALRRMQSVTLQALLTALDRQSTPPR